MTLFRNILIAIVSLTLLLFALLSWYKLEYSMNFVISREINSPDQPIHILVATQGSEFKNKVTDQLIDQLTNDTTYISVIDVSRLESIAENEWDVIVVMHTWENWEPQPDAERFVSRVVDRRKLVVLATSGAGDNQIEGIDRVSSASQLDTVNEEVKNLLKRIKEVLQNR